MRTSLILGAGGFIAGAVAERLIARGDRVVCIGFSKKPLGYRPLLEHAIWLYGNVLDDGFVRDAIARYEPQEVYHFAASSQVKAGERDPSGTVAVNVIGTRNVLEACRTVGNVGGILIASSDKAYGEPDHPVKEYDGLYPCHMYDATKAAADLIAQAYARDFKLPIVITRSCNVYGPGDLNWGRIFPAVCSKLSKNQPPILHQGADAMEREFIYVDDAVSAALHLVSQARTLTHNIYNVGTGDVVKVSDLVRMIISASGKDIEPEIKAASFQELKSQSVDASRIRMTGWEPRVSLECGILNTVSWYLNFLSR